ncbi:MAG: mechanosensitive ion channel family protein [Gammaproteobacteria bacterium]|nr:mechanosensitive ion channel family protein [Gammaproteobacteria bacterium]
MIVLNDIAWIGQILLVLALALVAGIVIKRILAGLEKQSAKTSTVWDDALLEAARRPLRALIVLYAAVFILEIAITQLQQFQLQQGAIYFLAAGGDGVFFPALRQIIVILLMAWFLLGFSNCFERRLLEKLKAEPDQAQTQMDPTTLHALVRLLRLVIVIAAILVVLPTLGVEITAVLAFGGIGGIAVGFAAQDLLANFFGGLMIYLDRPFAIGDWIRSPDREIEGTVEKIGWRLTVVRTFDKRPLYVPNSLFNKLSLENPSRMSHRRIYETIGIRYQDADKMGVIVEDVKAMLLAHEEIDTSQTMIVNFNYFAPSSLDFFVYTFTRTTNWIRFHEIKQDVLLRIVAIIHSHDADIAFPTTTIDGLAAVTPEPLPETTGAES